MFEREEPCVVRFDTNIYLVACGDASRLKDLVRRIDKNLYNFFHP